MDNTYKKVALEDIIIIAGELIQFWNTDLVCLGEIKLESSDKNKIVLTRSIIEIEDNMLFCGDTLGNLILYDINNFQNIIKSSEFTIVNGEIEDMVKLKSKYVVAIAWTHKNVTVFNVYTGEVVNNIETKSIQLLLYKNNELFGLQWHEIIKIDIDSSKIQSVCNLKKIEKGFVTEMIDIGEDKIATLSSVGIIEIINTKTNESIKQINIETQRCSEFRGISMLVNGDILYAKKSGLVGVVPKQTIHSNDNSFKDLFEGDYCGKMVIVNKEFIAMGGNNDLAIYDINSGMKIKNVEVPIIDFEVMKVIQRKK